MMLKKTLHYNESSDRIFAARISNAVRHDCESLCYMVRGPDMDDLSQRTLAALRKLGFEVQPTSFSDITATGEISRIREYRSLPNGDSFQILRYFPDFFVIHHFAVPERGIFFVTLASDNILLSKEAQSIYQRYFPKDLLIVGQSPEHDLVAVWVGSGNKPKPLEKVIHDRLEA